jgi:hypothetical protein
MFNSQMVKKNAAIHNTRGFCKERQLCDRLYLFNQHRCVTHLYYHHAIRPDEELLNEHPSNPFHPNNPINPGSDRIPGRKR